MANIKGDTLRNWLTQLDEALGVLWNVHVTNDEDASLDVTTQLLEEIYEEISACLEENHG